MQSTFTGIEIGKRGMVAHNVGLTTVGHNLTNASTEGYSRQRVELGSFEPIYAPHLNREETPGQIGQGVMVNRVERVRDMLLEGRIVAQTGDLGYWDTRDKYLAMLEQVYDEPTDVSVRSRLDRFWDAWQELSLHPDGMAQRIAVVERGSGLMDAVHERHRRLSDIRSMADRDIQGTVLQVNDLAMQVAKLNEEIVKVRALGDNPNDLLDRRDLLVEKLAALVPVVTDDRDPDEYMVHVGGRVLVQGSIARAFFVASDPGNDGFGEVVWADTLDRAELDGGSLGALIDVRDGDARDELRALDEMVLTFADLVNETHRSGYGLDGSTGVDFFEERPSVLNIAGNYDRDGDGAFDSSYIYRMTGANRLEAQAQIGLAGTITLSGPRGEQTLEYYPTDTVADLVSRINASGAEVTARLDRDGRLQLRASGSADRENPDFVIRHVEDSGEFLAGYSGLLAGSGPASAYDWAAPDAVLALRGGGTDFAVAPLSRPSGWLEVSDAVRFDPGRVAAGFGDGTGPAAAGDGSAALAIASLRDGALMVGRSPSFDDWFADTAARVGLKGERAEISRETASRIVKNLQDLRASISGVNIDEELSAMIKYQHGYAAAAKFISQVDEMLDTIINRMGV